MPADHSRRPIDADIDWILGGGGRMFLATSCGGLSSGATVFYGRDGDDLVFFTFNPTRKAEQIRANPRVQAAIWPEGQEGIRGLQIEGRCQLIKDDAGQQRARDAVLGVTDAFKDYMDDAFLVDNKVTGYYRLSPTAIKLVDFHAEPQFRWKTFPVNTPSPLADALGDGWRRFKLWVRALRAPFFTATIAPVALGAVIAASQLPAEARFNWQLFWLALFGALAAHAGTNLANDYGDHRSGNDEANKTPSPFNGGSRVIQAGLLPPWKVAFAAALCFGITIACGLGINEIIGGHMFATTPLLFIGILGVFLGTAYTLGPFRLGYHGLGEIAIALGFGPVMVLGTHYVLTSGQPWQWLEPLLASLPVAVLVTLIVWINQFQDVPADHKTGKRTLVVRLADTRGGFDYARPFRLYLVLGVLAFALVVALAALPFVSDMGNHWALLALLPSGLLWYAATRGRRWLDGIASDQVDWQRHPYHLLPVNVATIGMHLSTGALLVIAWGLKI